MRTAIRPRHLHYRQLAGHFLGLTSGDRLLRFGSVLTDIDIVAYLERLFGSAADVFVVVEPDEDISGVLAIEFAGDDVKLGLSVSSWARNLGIGRELLQRAGALACEWGLKTLFVPNLRLNVALQRLAVGLGMNVACAAGALTAIADAPRANGHQAHDRGFAGTITLADESLRSRSDVEKPDVRQRKTSSFYGGMHGEQTA